METTVPVSEVTQVVLDFLTSTIDDYKDLQYICLAFNAALDALNRTAHEHQKFTRYLEAIQDKMGELTRAHYERSRLL